MHDLFFQRYQELKSEDVKALRTSANEAQRASITDNAPALSRVINYS